MSAAFATCPLCEAGCGLELEPLSGTAVLNGIPVELEPARSQVLSA